ncbi:MAG: hypothetical protein ACT4TC_09875 [Myxococcaceae bacterium]
MNKLLLLLAALSATPSFAQDDTPIAYPDQSDDDDAPRRGRRTAESEMTSRASLSGYDDASVGLSADVFGAIVLLEAARGGGVDARGGFGAHLTWEVGRLLSNDFLHEGLFLDAMYLNAHNTEGTAEFSGSTTYHYFTVAPALGFQLGEGSPLTLFAQLGGGMTFEQGSFSALGTVASTSGLKPTFLYGVGLRGRPLLAESGVRLIFRVDITRFRRAYMDDTYFGASLGLGF